MAYFGPISLGVMQLYCLCKKNFKIRLFPLGVQVVQYHFLGISLDFSFVKCPEICI